jgi:hypothetical protein
MKPEDLDMLHSVAARMDGFAREMATLHERLSGVVNDRLAREVGYLTHDLRTAQLDLVKLTGALVSDAVRGAGEASRNMLTAALAGVEVASRKKPGEP